MSTLPGPHTNGFKIFPKMSVSCWRWKQTKQFVSWFSTVNSASITYRTHEKSPWTPLLKVIMKIAQLFVVNSSELMLNYITSSGITFIVRDWQPQRKDSEYIKCSVLKLTKNWRSATHHVFIPRGLVILFVQPIGHYKNITVQLFLAVELPANATGCICPSTATATAVGVAERKMAVLCRAAWHSANCGSHARWRRDAVVVATLVGCRGGQSGWTSRFLSCAAFGKPAWLPTALPKPTHEKDAKDEDYNDGGQYDAQPKQQTVRVHDEHTGRPLPWDTRWPGCTLCPFAIRNVWGCAKRSKARISQKFAFGRVNGARAARALNWDSLRRAVGARAGATLRRCARPLVLTSYRGELLG